jgi:inosose dehydratase
MTGSLTRRSFLGAAAAVACFPRPARALARARPQLGYAAITWQGRDLQAIDDISAAGYHGIQLRASVLPDWRDRPAELRRKLEDKKLALLCFSSGTVDADPAKAKEYEDLHLLNARFVRALGGERLQLISRRPAGRAPTPAEFERLGALLDAIGRRARDEGVRLVYHNHMDGFGEAPEEIARVMEATDDRYVSLLLDVAHCKQGGGDPVAAVAKHKDRIVVVHLKDVVSPVPGEAKPPRRSYRWVELGKGTVDLPGVVAALDAIAFQGPAIIELDAVPEPGRTPADCALANKTYAVTVLGLSL